MGGILPQDVPSHFIPERIGTRGPSWLLSLNSLFFGHIPSPFPPRLQSYHGVKWSVLPFCKCSVVNDELSSDSNSSLIEWAKSTHFWTCIRPTTLISQLWGSCINQLICLEWPFDPHPTQAIWEVQRALMKGIYWTNRTLHLTTNQYPRA